MQKEESRIAKATHVNTNRQNASIFTIMNNYEIKLLLKTYHENMFIDTCTTVVLHTSYLFSSLVLALNNSSTIILFRRL